MAFLHYFRRMTSVFIWNACGCSNGKTCNNNNHHHPLTHNSKTKMRSLLSSSSSSGSPRWIPNMYNVHHVQQCSSDIIIITVEWMWIYLTTLRESNRNGIPKSIKRRRVFSEMQKVLVLTAIWQVNRA